jgi:hypothetical protein
VTTDIVAGGDCTVGSSFVASNAAGGTGTLASGSATLEVDLVDPSGVVISLVTLPITLVGGTPSLAGIELSGSSAVIEGAFVPYTATIANPGGGLTGVSLQGFLHQGTTLRAASGSLVNCGNGGGILPTGTCAFTFGYSATNTAGGSGTLVPGSATLEVQLRGANGTVLDTRNLTVTLLSGVPHITGLTLSAATAVIGGAFVPYTATLQNLGASRSGIALQGFLHQGSVAQAAGGSVVNCGAGTGVLPTGTCTFTFGYVASNSAGGSGTLVPGPATLEVQLRDGTGRVLDSRNVAVTLQPFAPIITGLSLSSITPVIGGAFVPFTIALQNPTPTLSGVAVQSWVHQGSTLRAAGGSAVSCGSGTGVLPTGTCNVTAGYIVSSTAGGVGTLVAGSATLEVQLLDGTGKILDNRFVTVFLQNP